MKKILIGALIAVVLLAGCSNGVDSNKGDNHAEEAGQTENVTPPTTDESNNDNSNEQETVDKKAEYVEKLDLVEAGLSDLEELNEEGTTVAMTEAATQTYERWDAALNEIYAYLQEQLTDEQMNDLKDKQLQWIAERDETASAASKQFEGGTMETLEYMATQAQLTKERCYELVEQYM